MEWLSVESCRLIPCSIVLNIFNICKESTLHPPQCLFIKGILFIPSILIYGYVAVDISMPLLWA